MILCIAFRYCPNKLYSNEKCLAMISLCANSDRVYILFYFLVISPNGSYKKQQTKRFELVEITVPNFLRTNRDINFCESDINAKNVKENDE